MEYFIDALKKYADFKGRARRKEYWMFVLFYMIFYIATIIIDGILGGVIISIIYTLALLIPYISITARRLHDTSRSGWWQLLALIPLIGSIIIIVFLAQDSHDSNDYGKSHKLESEF